MTHDDEIVTRTAELGHAGVTSAEIQAVLDRAAEQRLQNAAQRRRQALEWLRFMDRWFANEVKNLRSLASVLMEGSV